MASSTVAEPRLEQGSIDHPYEVQVISDVQLPDDGTGDVAMTADLYFARELRSESVPLVVVAPGAAGPKEWYSQAGSNLARAGFAVLVVSQLRDVAEIGRLGVESPNGVNYARPHIFQQAIAWAEQPSSSTPSASMYPHFDTQNVYLLGHSYGAYLVAYAAARRIPPGFMSHMGLSDDAAAIKEPLRALPGVRGIFLYGWTLENQFSAPGTYDDSFRDVALPPVFVLFGGFDYLARGTHGTYKRLPSPKAVAVISNTNHFSITDRPWSNRKEPESTLSREDQVLRVTDMALLWFRMLRARADNSSRDLSKAGANAAWLLPFVKEYYSDVEQL